MIPEEILIIEGESLLKPPFLVLEIIIIEGKLSVRYKEQIFPVKNPDEKGVMWAEKWAGNIIDGYFQPGQFIKSLT